MRRPGLRSLLIVSALAGAPRAFAQDAGGPALSLHGAVSDDVRLRARIEYATIAANAECRRDDGLTGLLTPRRESRTIEATRASGGYELVLPLVRSGAPDACGWAPLTAFLCLGDAASPASGDQCVPLYLFRSGSEPPPSRATVTCTRPAFTCAFTPAPSEPYRQVPAAPARVELDVVMTRETR